MVDALAHIDPADADAEQTGDESSTEAGKNKKGVRKAVVSGRKPDNYPRDPKTDRPIPPDINLPKVRDMCRQFVNKEVLWQIRTRLY